MEEWEPGAPLGSPIIITLSGMDESDIQSITWVSGGSGQISFSGNQISLYTTGEFDINFAQDAKVEGTETLSLMVVDTGYYDVGDYGSMDIVVADGSFYATSNRATTNANNGNTINEGCGCGHDVEINQSGDIVIAYDVQIDTLWVNYDWILSEAELTMKIEFTGSNESISPQSKQNWFTVDVINDEQSAVSRFRFVFSRSLFPANAESAEFRVTLSNNENRLDGDGDSSQMVFTDIVNFAKSDSTVSNIPKAQVHEEGVVVNGNYYKNDGSGGYLASGESHGTLTATASGFTFVDDSNTEFLFNATGEIISKTDSRGRETHYYFTTINSLRKITSVVAPTITYNFSYDTFGKILQASNTSGEFVSFGYSGGLLTTATRNDPDGSGPLSALVTTYAYNSNSQLTSRTLPDGSVTTWTYDSLGYLASETASNGGATTYTSSQIASTASDYSGDALESVSSDGETTQYAYDRFGNVTREIDAEGNETLYIRDSHGLLLKKILPDPDGEGPLQSPVYEYTYDSRGNKLTETLPDESVRTWVYHATWNQPIQYTDAEGNITTWTYDSTYELMLTETKVIGLIDDGINLETDDLTNTYTYTDAPFWVTDPPQGMVESVTAADGMVTEYVYDVNGRRTSTTYAVGTADEASTSTTYDSDGNMLTQTDELGNTTTYTYDDLGRQLTITSADPDGAGPLSATVTTYTYNAQGKKATESINGRTTTYAYDAYGRLSSVTEEDPDDTGPLSAPVTSYTYDSDGNQLTVTDPLGNVTTNAYTDGKLTSVIQADPDGAGPLSAPVTSYTYDDAGRVLTVTDPLGRVTTYAYDSLGRQISVTMPDPDGVGALESLTSTTTYDLFGRVASKTNFDGTTVSYTYDSEGNKLTETTELGTTTYTYDELNRLETITTADPDGVGSLIALVTTYSYTASGQVGSITTPKGTTSYTYDNRRRRTSTTLPDPDGVGGASAPVSSVTYDDAGNVLTETDALGNVTAYEYDALNRVVKITSPDPDGAGALTSPETLYAYDEFGQQVSMTDPNGGVTTYEYDDLGRQTKVRYADPDGAGALTSPEVSYEYDAAGQLISMTDELGNETTYEYDNLGRQIKVTLPDPDGAGALTAPETTYSYDAAGQLLSTTDPLGRTTSYTYDNMGRQLTVTLPDPDGAGALTAPMTSYTYNADGQLASVTDAASQTVSYTYNAAGQVATMTDPNGTTTYTYDALGRQISITEPDPDGAGPLSAPTTTYAYDNEGDMVSMTTLDGTTSYEYDDLGRLTKMTMPDPDGVGSGLAAWTVYTYDAVGRMLTETNRLGNSTSYAYDNLGRLIKKTDAEGGETEYTYDANGNRLTLTDPEENTTTWTYDKLNRMLTNTNELNDTRSYKYDAAGNVVEYTDRNGRVTAYEYDNLQRRTTEKWMDGATVVETLSYAYDAASQLTEASDSQATYTFTYDNLGRNTSTEHDLAALGFDVVIDEAYDALGRRTSLTAEIDGTDDLVNNYAYDYYNRMTQVTQSGQVGGNAVAEKRVDFAYDAEDKGQFTSITRYANLAGSDLVATTTYGYDYADQITSITHTDGSSSTLAGYTYAYDEGNRLTAFSVYGYSAEDADYSYDDTDQLTGADRTGTTGDESYTYDENGNRTGGGYSTGDNNQLLSDGTFNYTYDDEGNRLTKTNISTGEVIEYTWDYRNRLVNITTKTSGGTVTHEVDYTYDIFNRRIVKTVDADGAGSGTATEEIYIYDGLREERGAAGDHMLLRFDEAEDLTDRYLYGANVDQILASEEVTSTASAGDALWALTDHLGTVRDVVDYDSGTNTTTAQNHLAYDAYGNITSETNSSVDFLFAFTGRERDEESGLQYNRARYYDALTGRWTGEDPLGFEAGDANLLRYVHNSSLRHLDPSGNQIVEGYTAWQAISDAGTVLTFLDLGISAVTSTISYQNASGYVDTIRVGLKGSITKDQFPETKYRPWLYKTRYDLERFRIEAKLDIYESDMLWSHPLTSKTETKEIDAPRPSQWPTNFNFQQIIVGAAMDVSIQVKEGWFGYGLVTASIDGNPQGDWGGEWGPIGRRNIEVGASMSITVTPIYVECGRHWNTWEPYSEVVSERWHQTIALVQVGAIKKY
ncbi:RHS repeat-associated core domain-containing protein [Bremerella sp. JC817]|uniref:RHS repeat-associated core domain-containing protein n=1 Tax=Bremerella sp. JC817 TaxID=3231756 RepID=UPI00345B34B1